MLLKLLRYVFGYVKAEVYGFAPERFMNLIINNEIVVWDVEHTENGYIFHTGGKNLLKMKPYLQKTNMKLKVHEKCGLPYFFRQHKRRATFAVGFLLFAVLVYVMSLFVWEVKVTGEDKLVVDNLLKQIESNYIRLGTLKSKVNCNQLEQVLRKDFEEISWISCELKGTVLTVYLEEGLAPKVNDFDSVTGDLVAAKDATIKKMITRQGTPIAKMNDTVKKGDILISGTVYIYDDNNEVIETNYIRGDGDVYGQTDFAYEDYVELKYYQKEYMENAKTHITLYFMDYCFTPYIPDMDSDNYDTYTQIHKACVLNNFYLPFGYKSIKRTPYALKAATYTEEQAKAILEERLQKKIESFTEKGVEIVENGVTIETDGEKMTALGTLKLIEPIAVLKQYSNTVQNDDNDKK